MPPNGAEDVKVGSWLFIGFYGCCCSQRDTHGCVEGLCRDRAERRARGMGGGCLEQWGGIYILSRHSYLSGGEDGRGSMAVGETEHALCIFHWMAFITEAYQRRLSLLNYSFSNPPPPSLPLLFLFSISPTSMALSVFLLPFRQLYWIFSPFQMN